MNTYQAIVDLNLIQKYNISGPRYTSYPTAVKFHSEFSEQDYQQAVSDMPPKQALSLYFHLPFCDTVCYYCACNKVVTKRREKVAPYLAKLSQELAMQSALFNDVTQHKVMQLHWGGGTPTFFSHAEMQQLMQAIAENFQLLPNDQGEYSIEIDPREVQAETIALLRDLGFNRLSLGVQDFDPKVQQAVNRIQSEQQTYQVLEQAKAQGFLSMSVDLIYGLPFQSEQSFAQTLDKIITASPDRISLFNYAHLPHLFKPQRRINAEDLPSAPVKLAILQQSVERLISAGYVFIGMDHFAKKTDELSIAQQQGRLHRNFQGYATHGDCDLFAFGVSSIAQIGKIYSQNYRQLAPYYHALSQGKLPIQRGLVLKQDDIIRRSIIQQLMCHFQLDFTRIENLYHIEFQHYFQTELARLQIMQQDGLLMLFPNQLQVTAKGRLLIRQIAMVFDAYFTPTDTNTTNYSKAI